MKARIAIFALLMGLLELTVIAADVDEPQQPVRNDPIYGLVHVDLPEELLGMNAAILRDVLEERQDDLIRDAEALQPYNDLVANRIALMNEKQLLLSTNEKEQAKRITEVEQKLAAINTELADINTDMVQETQDSYNENLKIINAINYHLNVLIPAMI